MNMTAAVLLTCFNRVNVTLLSLRSLYACMEKCPNVIFDVYLVDDASPDGTYDAVHKEFPSINMIRGTGDLFWGGGMNLAWKHAVENKRYDYYIWMNDDGELCEDALASLFEVSTNNNIVVGVFSDKEMNVVTYGGKIEDPGDFILIDQYPECENIKYMNGNLVLISRYAFESLGYIDRKFRHGIGDYDYSLRAVKKGIRVVLTRKIVGYCSRHDHVRPKCFDKRYPLRIRLANLYIPNGPSPFSRFRYLARHYSLYKAVYSFIAIHYRVFFPL